jgi:V8-like Glu-specific endopeptidase
MARIVLNKIWDELKKIWVELGNLKEEEIDLEVTRISGGNLATLINQRLKLRSQKLSSQVLNELNENDLLPFSFFEEGQNAGKGVCCLTRRITKLGDLNNLIKAAKDQPRLQAILLEWYLIDPVREPERFKEKAPTVNLPYASGFLVGGDYLLTNRHVVEQKDLLPEFRAVFNYEADSRRQESHPELLARLDKYEFDPSFWVTPLTGSDLDYVLLKLKPLNGKSVSVSFKGVNLAKTLEGAIAPGLTKQNLANDPDLKANLDEDFVTLVETKDFVSADPIHMIQHPGGRPKEIVVFNNRLVNVYKNFLEYETDAEPGSSGSPLFNTSWQVVGLHQAALLDENSPERKIKGYLGIRMDSILTDLRAQAPNNSDPRDFLEKYVDRTAPPTKPQVFILAGRQRSFLEDDAELERQAMENLQQAIATELARRDPTVRAVSVSGHPEQPHQGALNLAIREINQQRNPEQQQGELAIELLTNRSGSPSKSHGITLYYSAANPRAQQLAQCLQSALKAASPLPYIGAVPDSYTSSRRLAFCREVNLPAVVIYVGYLDNASDRAYIEALQQNPAAAESLATSLTEGIFAALKEREN